MQHGDGASARTCPFSGATASV
ncbi:MAG: hypothetical protein QOF52_2969, partial [Propionibacteriaceae bacterium]|nr:hypothetical protein [Propionibacteriaceae bacterium]